MDSLFSMLSPLNGMATGLLFWVGQALVFGSVLALATWLVTSIALRRMRPALHAAFWAIVLVKFIVPIGPEFSYSFSSLVSAWSPVTLLPTAAAVVEAPPAPPTGGEWVVYAIPLAHSAGATPARSLPVRAPISSLVAIAYFIGLAIVAALRLIAYVRFVRQCRRLEPASPFVAAEVAAIARRAGVRRLPGVRISDTASAPFIYGAVRPTLVLARRHLDRPAEFDAVVLHEIAHLRRGDMLVRYLQWLAGTVLYFWPVVAWVNRRIDLAREHACDEWALRRSVLSPAQYARCLLDCVQRTRPRLAAYAPASMAARASHVQRRIEMILNSTDSPRAGQWVKLVAGAALIGWTGFALSGASAASLKSDGKKKARPSPQISVQPVNDDQEALISVEPMITDAVEGVPLRIALHLSTAAEGGAREAYAQAVHLIMVQRDDGAPQLASTVARRFAFHHAVGAPGLDLNGDGDVTPEEHDAFVVAKAMSNPDAVLAQFPDADADSDGTLSADEAAELIGGPFSAPLPPPPPPGAGVFTLAPQISGEGEVQIVLDAQTEGPEAVTTLIARNLTIAPQQLEIAVDESVDAEAGVWIAAPAAGEGCMEGHVEAQVEAAPAVEATGVPILSDLPLIGNFFRPNSIEPATDDVGPVPLIGHLLADHAVEGRWVRSAGEAGVPALPPAAWIMTNIEGQPAKEAVAAQVDRTLAAALRRFLKMHPKSDRNEDGVLTVEERDAYVDKMQSTTRERYLDANPEADTDEDGILTPAEMRAHQRSQREARAEARGAFRVRSAFTPLRLDRAAEVTEPAEENDGPK